MIQSGIEMFCGRSGKNVLFQWLGNEVIHQALEGRLLLIHLLCKHNARRISAPCIALRVAGSPGNISSVQSSSWQGPLRVRLPQRHHSPPVLCAGSIQNTTRLARMNPVIWKDCQLQVECLHYLAIFSFVSVQSMEICSIRVCVAYHLESSRYVPAALLDSHNGW